MDSDNDRTTRQEVPVEKTISDLIVGPPKNVRDPRLFHSLSLVAFLAWVGLGSDGLSSSCYGPEEAFLALGQHQYLAVFLALLSTLAVLLPRWRRHARAQAGSVLEAPPLDPAATARLDADLARFD